MFRSLLPQLIVASNLPLLEKLTEGSVWWELQANLVSLYGSYLAIQKHNRLLEIWVFQIIQVDHTVDQIPLLLNISNNLARFSCLVSYSCSVTLRVQKGSEPDSLGSIDKMEGCDRIHDDCTNNFLLLSTGQGLHQHNLYLLWQQKLINYTGIFHLLSSL